MPGVGVAPLGRGFPASFGSGMPGVGVAPFGGTFAFIELVSEIPGVEFPEGVIGAVESPGGISFGSMFVAVFAAFALALGVVADWQAKFNKQTRPIKTGNIIFVIIKNKNL